MTSGAIGNLEKYEQIKAGKSVEMRDKRRNAKIYLEDALKDAVVYVGGDRIQSSSKDIRSKINEGLEKLINTLYHKLSYITMPVTEGDILSVLTDNGGQLSLDNEGSKSKVETTFAEISMTTNISKITNLSVNLEFFQRQPVSDVVKPATYHIYFEAEDGERVSNENQYHADSAESNPLNTKAKLRFSFKNRIYSNKDKYYLIIMDEEHNIQLAKIPFTIDIAMANDFGF